MAILTAICQYVDMVCVYCGGNTKVSNSRPQVKSNRIWRRRSCSSCQAVFTTIELYDPAQTWMVYGSDDKPTVFISEKLFLSIYESLKHRPAALLDAKHLSETVINKLGRTTNNGVIKKDTITKTVSVSLHRFDKVAHTHYQAFHKP